MLWPMLFVTLAFCGIAVLGAAALKVGIEVRRFTLAVGDSSERLTRATEDLERAAVPLSARAAHSVGPQTGVRPGEPGAGNSG